MSSSPLLRAARALPLLLLIFGTGGCGELPFLGAGAETIDEEVFIAVYVDLRVEALGGPTGELSSVDRRRILEEHQVTEEELLRFVEVHGTDVHYMKRIWDEAHRRIRAVDEELLEEASRPKDTEDGEEEGPGP